MSKVEYSAMLKIAGLSAELPIAAEILISSLTDI